MIILEQRTNNFMVFFGDLLLTLSFNIGSIVVLGMLACKISSFYSENYLLS